MTIADAIPKIVSDVKKNLIQDFNPSIYVGKTNDILRRTNEHFNEGLPCTLRIAHGNPILITKLEEQLIFQFKNIKNCTLLNKDTVSKGSSDANWIYISLNACHPDDELCEYDEVQILGNDYPLTLSNG